MIITNMGKNSFPEQVQENFENIQALNAALSNSQMLIGKNLWTNPDTTAIFEKQVITSDEFLAPYNVLKIYVFNTISGTATIQTIMLDLDVNYPVEANYITGTNKHFRTITYNSLANEVEFSDEQILDLLTGDTSEGDNNYLVPLAIIGFQEKVTA